MQLVPLVLVALLLSTVGASAQATVSTRSPKPLAWDQPAPDRATAQGYQYQLLVDGQIVILPTPVCAGTAAPFLCAVPFPALTPGPHALQLVAVDLGPDPDEASDPSNVLAVLVTVTPMAPQNLRLGSAPAASATPVASTSSDQNGAPPGTGAKP